MDTYRILHTHNDETKSETNSDQFTSRDKDPDSPNEHDVPLESDKSDEYDTDIEMDNALSGDEYDVEAAVRAYTAACEELGITPSARLLDKLTGRELQLKYRGLGPTGARALAAALSHNKKITVLNLEDNGIGPDGANDIADMLKENHTITYVNLSKNQLGGHGSRHLASMLKNNNIISYLDLSDNLLDDNDAERLSAGIERNERIVHLDLSKNCFSEEGAIHLGRAVGFNNSVETLNLSWNQLKRKGAVAICNGLKRNYCITCVDLAWNGFGYEGGLAVGELLRGNKYLREIDVSNNRINWEGALLIMKGLKENDTLEVIKIGHNPLTTTGCLDILEAVDNPVSVCNFVGFDGIPVNRKIIYMMETLQKNRPFEMTHGGLLESDDIFGKRMVLRCDPLKLLIQFLSDKGIRPVDLFRTFDKDNQHRVSREQFIQGLKRAKVPLDEYELERVLNRLDSAKEGKISYQRLMRGVKEQIKVNRAEERRKMQEEKRQSEDHKRIMNLPPITETSVRKLTDELTRSVNSLSQARPSSASSMSTVTTNVPASLKSYDSQLVSSRTSVHSRASVRAAGALRSDSRGSLPRINMSAPLGSQSVIIGYRQ